MFAIAREADAESRLARMLTYYTLTVGFAALVISVWAREIVWLMSTPDFFDADPVEVATSSREEAHHLLLHRHRLAPAEVGDAGADVVGKIVEE